MKRSGFSMVVLPLLILSGCRGEKRPVQPADPPDPPDLAAIGALLPAGTKMESVAEILGRHGFVCEREERIMYPEPTETFIAEVGCRFKAPRDAQSRVTVTVTGERGIYKGFTLSIDTTER